MDNLVLADLESGEEGVSLNELRHHSLLRRDDGRGPDLASLYRWTGRGCRGVVLQSVDRPSAAGGRVTTVSALMRFLAGITAARNGEPVPSATRSPRRRRQDIAAASARLEAAGI